jgi:citrate synthase
MTPPAGASPEDIGVLSSFGAAARVLERHGTDRLTRPRSETVGPTLAASVSLDER